MKREESNWMTASRGWVLALGVVLCVISVSTVAFAESGDRQGGRAGGETSEVDEAINAARDDVWMGVARGDAKIKALGVATRSGGDKAGAAASLYDDLPQAVRERAVIMLADGRVALAVDRGRFKVEVDTTIPGGTLMITSYAILLLLLFGFIGLLAWRERRLSDELDALESRIAAGIDDGELD